MHSSVLRLLLSSLAVVGMLTAGGTILLSGAAAQEIPLTEAEAVEADTLTIDRRGGLSLYGAPFSPQPSTGYSTFAPRSLTLWLPKEVSLLGGDKVKACSKAKVRNAKFPDGLNGCTGIGAGRMNSRQGGKAQEAWYAVAGPKQGKKRLVWLTTKMDWDNNCDCYPSYGLETGVIQEASGAYGTKLVLRFGGLDIRARALEVQISNLRETEKCPSGGWPLKLKVVAAEGSDSRTWRARCDGGGQGSGGGGGGRSGGGRP
jgi:hypothetical protein